MTREQACNIIEKMLFNMKMNKVSHIWEYDETEEALVMAVKALANNPCASCSLHIGAHYYYDGNPFRNSFDQ